jgi:Cu-Zn family superoxide dismutase
MHRAIALAGTLLLVAAPAFAGDISVPMNLVDAAGKATPIGTVRVVETAYGLVFAPELAQLPPGLHGFHVHENPSCAPAAKDGAPVAALAAGGHYDPKGTQRHAEPWGEGHLGDLPALYVAQDGTASYAVLAPRLKSLAELRGRSLMIHAGSDNHADHPAPLGGGGARMACGVIPPGA